MTRITAAMLFALAASPAVAGEVPGHAAAVVKYGGYHPQVSPPGRVECRQINPYDPRTGQTKPVVTCHFVPD